MNHFRNNLSRFRLITFDVTDTLLEYSMRPELYYLQVINSVLEPRLGLSIEEKAIGTSFVRCFGKMKKQYPNFGCGRKQFSQPAFSNHKIQDENWRWWWRTLVEQVILDAAADSDCHAIPSPILTTIAEQLIDDYTFDAKHICWRQRPGIADFLKKLRIPGRIIGIVSNFDPRLEIILRNNGINRSDDVQSGAIDFILTSYDVGVEKPDPTIFEIALKRANLLNTSSDNIIRPCEALHIGNLCREDYTGARNAGWHALLVNVTQTKKNHELFSAIPSKYIFTGLPDLQNRMEKDASFQW
ncbi:rhythmically expressed gene 2 protein-like [Anopheles nili]|uniref:rhythmically expressed gene 2 protein-like n=1 Tax=Anopheles nili TaxID=185578 RepID=UPI00237B7017|nr:rhythmically expressed gene 2 protein-like [Anopheles nili]